MTRSVRDDVVTAIVHALFALLHDPDVTSSWEKLEEAVRSLLYASLAATFHFTQVESPEPCDCPDAVRPGSISGMPLCGGKEYCPLSGGPSFGFRYFPDKLG